MIRINRGHRSVGRPVWIFNLFNNKGQCFQLKYNFNPGINNSFAIRGVLKRIKKQ